VAKLPPETVARVDIVTLSFRDRPHWPVYLEALAHLAYPLEKLELIIVDNGSTDGSVEFLKAQLPGLPLRSQLLLAGRNLGFAGGCNHGAAHGSAPFIWFLNPDTAVHPESLSRLVARASQEPAAGLIDAVQEPVEVRKWYDPVTHYTDWCSGATVLARRQAFLEVGMFDAFFSPAYGEDVDLSWRIWLGRWKCVYEPTARVQHFGQGGPAKPLEVFLSVRFSFAMRLIYDTPRGALGHFVRGFRYLASPRTQGPMRRAVVSGLWTTLRGLPHLLRRRRKAQKALRTSSERPRFVFSEWYYGRWRASS
jgi:GT2 family glycosyltransferase